MWTTLCALIALVFGVQPVAFSKRHVPLSIQHLAVSIENWPSWRGPTGNGISTETNLPLHWSRTENVAWKLAMPAFSGIDPRRLGASDLPERRR